MPALPFVAKVIRIDLVQSIGPNTRVRNRLFFQYSGTLSQADLTTILNTVASKWTTSRAPDLNPVITLTQVIGTDLSNASAAQAAVSASQAGTAAGTALPAGTAMVFKFKIARRYRGGHPRFYQGGYATGQTASATTWNATAVANNATDFATFISTSLASPPAAVGTLSHVNVHYFSGFTNKTFPSGRVRAVPTLLASPVVDPVISYSVNPNIASQRRRNLQSA